MSINGLLTDVRWEWTGTEITTDLLTGATVLNVLDPECASVEDELWVLETGPYEITAVDVDASTFTIDPALTVDADSGTEVAFDIGGTPGKLWVAEVILPDADKPIEVPLTVRDLSVMRQGSYDPPVAILLSDDLEHVEDLIGSVPSIDGGFIEPGTLPYKWEWDDPHVLTTADVTAGTFTLNLKHKGIVEGYAFDAFVNGAAIDPSRLTLDADNGVVTVPLAGWEKAGYRFRFKYVYTTPDPVVIAEPVPVSYVGFNAGGNIASSLAFPAGVQAGDLAIAVVNGRTSGGTDLTDSRFTIRENATMGLNTVKIGTWVIDSSSPAAVAMHAPDLGGVQEGVGMIYVIRPSVSIDVLPTPTDSVSTVSASFAIPGFSYASGGVAILATQGGIGGAYAWGLSGSNVHDTGGSYALIYMALQNVRPVVPAANATYGGIGSGRGWMVGLGLG